MKAGGRDPQADTARWNLLHPVDLVEGEYRPAGFLCHGKRTGGCTGGRRTVFQMLSASNGGRQQSLAQEGGYDYFTTTLVHQSLEKCGKDQ